MIRVPLTFLLLLAAVLDANGAAAGELCRFPALDAENPFRRWLGSQEVTCVASGSRPEFPSGSWNVFARAEGAVSAAPLLVDGDAEPASIAPPLVPAATVTALLPEGHAGVVYVPRRGSAFPLEDGRATVPADEPLWLFVLRKSVPAAVIPLAPVPRGSERRADARGGGPPAVVGWLHMPAAERTALETATGVSSPVIRSGTRDSDPLPSPSLLHGAFFRIPDVPPAAAELRVEGRGWIPDRRMVKVQPGVTVAPAALLLRATGTLVVHWNSDEDLSALHDSLGSCNEGDGPPKLVITVSKCPPPRAGRQDGPADCDTIREEVVTELPGSLAFDDIVPGLYRAEMRFGNLPPAAGMASVGALRVADLRIFASYYTAYGSITHGGEPLGEPVRITFPGGTGFTEEGSEDYRAVFRPPPIDSDVQIAVEACDGSPKAIVLSDKPMRPRARFDIDIPANELNVLVTDTFTREPLAGVTVKLEAFAVLRHRGVVFTAMKRTGPDGRVVWTSIPVRDIQLTASHGAYETRRVEIFTMPKSGTEKMEVQLVPLRGTRGKIVSDRPFDRASVVWFSPSGAEVERAELDADGTFVHANWHTPEETMAVVSASHPLWVLRSPATERRQTITLRFPDAPAAAFDVWLAADVPSTETRHTGIVIGGVRVPQPVLAQHQTLRRDPPLLRGDGPQHFRDLLATGPIEVLLGPRPEDVPTRARAMDLFALPDYANAPRQRLDRGAAGVVFAVE